MINNVFGKNILFIAPKFFGYEREINNKLIEMGAKVDYFDERPSNDFMTKSLIRINRRLLARKNNKYYEDIINKTKDNKYDFILIIRAEAISRAKLKKLKATHNCAKLILYLWDSLSYNPNTKKIEDLFDHIYTFDHNDAKKYVNYHFRPSFFIDAYKDTSTVAEDIDVLFVGTVHTDRYMVLKKMKAQFDDMGLNYHFYMYYPSKLLFWIKKIFDPRFKGVRFNDLKFTSLDAEEVTSLYARAKAILDIERPKQNGLTIRTIEVLASKKKMITTNHSIVSYDFYNENNYLIIDRNRPFMKKEFLQQTYRNIDENIYNFYSIEKWICDIFSVEVQ